MNFIKNNYMSLLIMFFLIIVFTLGFLKSKKDFDSMYSSSEYTYLYCIKNNLDNDRCNYLIENHNNKEIMTADTFTIFFTSLMSQNNSWINYILIILIVLPTLFHFCKLCKSKMTINILDRKQYSRFLKNIIIDCYKKIWILIIPIVLLFIFSYVYSGHFNYTYIINSGAYYSFYVNLNPIVYIILYVFCIFLFFIFFTNIGLIIARKNHNIIIVVIESFLFFIVIDIILELVLGLIISNILYNGFSSRFNLVNILNIGYAQNIFEMITLPVCLVIISFIILKIIYKSKEKFIIECEKNN